MKRVTMGGGDTVVTDDGLAELILRYAGALGRAVTTDTVTVPAVLRHAAAEASLLLGPASQITVLPDGDEQDAGLVLPGLELTRADLESRIAVLTGRPVRDEGTPAVSEAFPDFDEYG